MPIIITRGATIHTGPQATSLVRLRVMQHALRIEIQSNGRLRLTRNAPAVTTILKREFGFKGNKAAMLAQLTDYIACVERGVAIVDEREGAK